MSMIIYPILGVLIVGLMGFCFAVGAYGLVMLIQAEKDRHKND